MLNKIKTSHLFNIFIFLLIILLIVIFRDFFNVGLKGQDKGYTDKNSLVDEIKNICVKETIDKQISKETCYSKEFDKIAYKNGPEYAFDVLFGLQKKDSDAIGCHFIAHGIGSGTYRKNPNDWQNQITKINSACSYGAPMGVIELYVASLGDGSLSKEFAPTLCGANPRADCNHMVGHLILVDSSVKGNISKAIDICTVFKDATQRNFCQTGVFMENVTALGLIDHGYADKSYLNWPERVDGLEKLCRSYKGEEAAACWEEIVHAAIVKFNNDPKKTFDFCNSSQSEDGAKRCKRHSIGIIGASKNFNLTLLKPMCSIPQKNDPDFEKQCYPALVSSALSTIPDGVPEAISFCNSLEGEFQPSCFSMIGAFSSYGSWPKEEFQKACNEAPAEYRSYCTGASLVPYGASYNRNND